MYLDFVIVVLNARLSATFGNFSGTLRATIVGGYHLPHTLWGGTTHRQTKCVAHPYWIGRCLANIALGVVQVLMRRWGACTTSGVCSPWHQFSHIHNPVTLVVPSVTPVIVCPSVANFHDDLAMLANHYTCHVSSGTDGCKAHRVGT